MNIFVLDFDTEKCAEYHNDKHCSKMILETAQLLSTTVRFLGFDVGYKSTHINHPCSIWLRQSFMNFKWTSNLLQNLNFEFMKRYKKVHKSYLMVNEKIIPLANSIEQKYGEKNLPLMTMTPFALAMPQKYKTDDPIQSYRNYYIGEKQHLAKWSNGKIPEWWIDKNGI